MKTYAIACLFLLHSFLALSQQLNLAKASPFTAVKWQNKQPIVQFKNEWYTLEKLDVHTTQALLDFCKAQYGSKWQKRFSEDLVAVLQTMNTPPQTTVQLILSKNNTTITTIGTYTFENRQKVLLYNKQHNTLTKSPTILTPLQAIADIDEFYSILKKQSAYYTITKYPVQNAIAALKNNITQTKKDVTVAYLTHELAKIMAQLGDRHSSIKNEGFAIPEHATYSLQFPFIIAPLYGKATALIPATKSKNYMYLYPNFPQVKTINNIPVSKLTDSLAYRSKKAPKAAKLTRGLAALQHYGQLYYANNLTPLKQLQVVFTNGTTDTTTTVTLTANRLKYQSDIENRLHDISKAINKHNYSTMTQILPDSVGYIALPEMYHPEELPGLEQFIDSTFTTFAHTKALIIDLRYNPGGGRELIQKFAAYLIPKTHTPWVANVAYLRTHSPNSDYPSMTGRYLFTSASAHFTGTQKQAITTFSKQFAMQYKFDTVKFSQPHYMVLSSGNNPYTHPVYLLVNEHSFSAASVFTSAFKGLPNVSIAGVTTDGSSGNSIKLYLKNSNIRVKVSTMLSFQRNGKTLDGNGTPPDYYLPETEIQVLQGVDTQLNQLVEFITKKH